MLLRVDEIRNIVFSGGGVRGYSYVGVLSELKDRGVDLTRLEGIGGTSIGALLAVLVASGWEPAQMREELLTVQVRTLVELNLTTLWYEYGFDSGKELEAYIDSLIHRRRSRWKITFAELFRLTGIRLVIVGCNLNKNTELVFSHETTPEMMVARACVMSMAIPGLFAPQRHKNDFVVDGGLKNNFPLGYFPASSTLGVRVQWGESNSLSSMDQVLARAVYCILNETQSAQWRDLTPQQRGNTVTVNVGDLATIDLRLTLEHKRRIIRRGQLAVRRAFSRNPDVDRKRRLAALAVAACVNYVVHEMGFSIERTIEGSSAM